MVKIRALSAAAEVKSLRMAPLLWDIEQGREQIEALGQEKRESSDATGQTDMQKRDPRASVADRDFGTCRNCGHASADIGNSGANRKLRTRKEGEQTCGSALHSIRTWEDIRVNNIWLIPTQSQSEYEPRKEGQFFGRE